MTDIEKTGTADRPPIPPTPSTGPEAIKAIPVRHYGRYVSAVVAIAALVAIIYAFSQGRINWGAVPDYFFDDRIIKGVGQTLLLTALSMVIGIVGGVLLAVMRLSKNPVTSSIAWFYIWFFRGTPVWSSCSSGSTWGWSSPPSTSDRSTRTTGRAS